MSNGRPWTGEDDATVKRMAQAGYSDAEIARHMGRDRDVIGLKRRGLNIRPGLSPALVAMMARINTRRTRLTFAYRT